MTRHPSTLRVFALAPGRLVPPSMESQPRPPSNPLTRPLPCNILDISDGLPPDIARQPVGTSVKLLDASRRYQ
jgi:hypothetical protein